VPLLPFSVWQVALAGSPFFEGTATGVEVRIMVEDTYGLFKHQKGHLLRVHIGYTHKSLWYKNITQLCVTSLSYVMACMRWSLRPQLAFEDYSTNLWSVSINRYASYSNTN